MPATDADAMTTAKAAERLGVSVQTVQKWVDAGVLPAWKTAGGHRRVPVAAVERMLSERAGATSGQVASTQALSVLLVEDDADTRELLAFQLSRLLPDARVRAFADAFAALVDAGREPPDALVTDLRLPGLDGAAMLRSLLARPQTAQVRVLVVTSCTPAELAAYGPLPRNAQVLHKPVATPALRAVVETWVRSA